MKKKKVIGVLLIAFVLLICWIIKCYIPNYKLKQIYSYEIDKEKGEVTITDYHSDEKVHKKYWTKRKLGMYSEEDEISYTVKLVIPATIKGYPVTAIGDNAFENAHFEEVVLPSSVLNIGDNAFLQCENLKNIQGTENVKCIKEGAFAHCYALKDAYMYDSVQDIGWNSFADIESQIIIHAPKGSYAEQYALDNGIKFEEWDGREIISDADDNTPLTQEYVCGEFGISESEFQGVDFNDFVVYYGLTYDNIHNEDVKFLLDNYKENNGEQEFYSYKYMYNGTADAMLTIDNKDDVQVVFCSKIEDDLNSFWVYDFKKGIKIVGNGSEDIISRDDIVAQLTDEYKNQILEVFDKYDVYSWYERKSELKAGTWYISVEFSDGTIAVVSGSSDDKDIEFEGFLEELGK